ncbi:hypothetical protein D2V05_09660 [Flagellimonas pelagia]|uniref:Uncharacterized protein n=1 Tax=Flagellimonas pelagia TaxID=2306998 RepID=A0A3A1NLF9_9FLAO|nr:hypothetical protein D2V05_09660 [Allomuricauda maritima]
MNKYVGLCLKNTTNDEPSSFLGNNAAIIASQGKRICIGLKLKPKLAIVTPLNNKQRTTKKAVNPIALIFKTLFINCVYE